MAGTQGAEVDVGTGTVVGTTNKEQPLLLLDPQKTWDLGRDRTAITAHEKLPSRTTTTIARGKYLTQRDEGKAQRADCE